MSYQLSFKQLRHANKTRLKSSVFEDDDWSVSDWLMAVTGELGELANTLKKVRRGDITLAEAHHAVEAEFADIVMYLDILAAELTVDLNRAVIAKFNIVSNRVNSDLYLNREGELLSSPPGYGPPAI